MAPPKKRFPWASWIFWGIFFGLPIAASVGMQLRSYGDAEDTSHWMEKILASEGPEKLRSFPGVYFRDREDLVTFFSANSSPLTTRRIGASPSGTPVWLEWRKGDEVRKARFHGWVLLGIEPQTYK